MKHVDLFSGIGGFALACDWAGIETVCFVEIDKFCQKVLKKHWPEVAIVEDVNNVEEIKAIITTNAARDVRQPSLTQQNQRRISDKDKQDTEGIASLALGEGRERWRGREGDSTRTEARLSGCNDSLLLTAGFPCQPFSNAGRKRGARDDRYLWPQTLAVIKAVKPDWIILENVAGLLNMVFPDSETRVASQASFCEVPNDEIADYNTISGGIDRDLREAGYETVWLVIPACSLGAPHRRDRVWIVGYAPGDRWFGRGTGVKAQEGLQQRPEHDGQLARGFEGPYSDVSDAQGVGLQGSIEPDSNEGTQPRDQQFNGLCGAIPDWHENWYEVATRFCRVDARIPDRVDRLKALGNAIVPQVAYQIIKAIKETAI